MQYHFAKISCILIPYDKNYRKYILTHLRWGLHLRNAIAAG